MLVVNCIAKKINIANILSWKQQLVVNRIETMSGKDKIRKAGTQCLIL